jgi:histidine triad (HIT) family protein
MTDCIFCRIAKHEAKAEVIYEDDLVVGFKDANPVAPIHVLIIPRKHIPTLNDVNADDHIVSHMAFAARKIAQDLGVADAGYRFSMNVNRGGGQIVFHLHAHLMAGKNLVAVVVRLAVLASILWGKLVKLLRRK